MNEELKLVRMKRAINTLLSDIKTRVFPVYQIIIFGSVVRKEITERSDMDVCIVCDDTLTIQQKREIENYFYDILQDELSTDFIYCTQDKLLEGQKVFKNVRDEGRIIYEQL